MQRCQHIQDPRTMTQNLSQWTDQECMQHVIPMLNLYIYLLLTLLQAWLGPSFSHRDNYMVIPIICVVTLVIFFSMKATMYYLQAQFSGEKVL